MAINPLQQPINYLAMAPQVNIAQKFAELGNVLAERRQLQQAEEAKRQYAIDLQETLKNPTQAAFVQLIAKHPGQSQAIGAMSQMVNKEQIDNEFNLGMRISTAIENGNIEVANNLLSQVLAGHKTTGTDPGIYQDVSDLLAAGNVTGAQATTNAVLSILKPDAFKTISEANAKRSEEERAEELQQFKVRQETANAIIKEAEAKYAPDNFGAELGLTQAQIEQAKAARRASDAAAKKSGAEAARAQAEADSMAAGVIPVDKRPEAERNFRKEYSDQTKGYQEVKSAYGRVLSSQEDAAGDIALIFNYMKMLDPGSTVREGEFATASNAGGIDAKVYNLYNKLLTGKLLKPEQRKMFANQAGKLYETAQKQEATVRDGIGRIAKGYGLNTANIFYEATETAPTAPGAPVSVTAPNGQVLTFPNQQAADAFKKAAGL